MYSDSDFTLINHEFLFFLFYKKIFFSSLKPAHWNLYLILVFSPFLFFFKKWSYEVLQSKQLLSSILFSWNQSLLLSHKFRTHLTPSKLTKGFRASYFNRFIRFVIINIHESKLKDSATFFLLLINIFLVLHQPLIRWIDGDFFDCALWFPNCKIIVWSCPSNRLKTVLLPQALTFRNALAQRNIKLSIVPQYTY
jgi:hypothetical protein